MRFDRVAAAVTADATWTGGGGDPPSPTGLHHASVIDGDPDGAVGFYRDALGLRPVKRTVNYDDPEVHHLYFGDGAGTLGTVLTTFPTPGDPPGRVGRGQPSALALAVPEGSFPTWRGRLSAAGATVADAVDRFDDRVIPVRSPDGLPLELLALAPDDRRHVDGWTHWDGSDVPESAAVRGLAGVTLRSAAPVRTAALLETFGFEQIGEAGRRVRYAGAGDRPAVLDLLTDATGEFGREGPGTIHHLALTVPDDRALLDWRGVLFERGLEPSHPRDRTYFRSLYVRGPGGILFELATPAPGLTADEPVADLGGGVRLPDWLADDRGRITSQLPPITAFD
jgi:glyoxalase family protein